MMAVRVNVYPHENIWGLKLSYAWPAPPALEVETASLRQASNWPSGTALRCNRFAVYSLRLFRFWEINDQDPIFEGSAHLRRVDH